MADRILKNSPLNVLDGGFASFGGVEFSGGKKISSAAKSVSGGRTAVTITFADGNIYRLDCIKNGDNISDIREYWNGNLIGG